MKLYLPDNSIYPHIEVEFEHGQIEVTTIFKFNKDCPIDLKTATFSGERYQRKVGIWENDCFELFLQSNENSSYYEVNIDPHSFYWNAFYFSGYRAGPLKETDNISLLEVKCGPESFSFKLRLPKTPSGFILHPKLILYPHELPPLYLSNLEHPASGPDFHLFSRP